MALGERRERHGRAQRGRPGAEGGEARAQGGLRASCDCGAQKGARVHMGAPAAEDARTDRRAPECVCGPLGDPYPALGACLIHAERPRVVQAAHETPEQATLAQRDRVRVEGGTQAEHAAHHAPRIVTVPPSSEPPRSLMMRASLRSRRPLCSQ